MNRQISVIIITRNRAEMLSRALSSLIEQSRLPDEVIVIDNASSDETKKVILSFKKNLPIKYVYEQKIGIPYARNKGIKVAKGSIIFMIDDDCEADKLWIEKMVKAHKKYPKAWVIQGRSISAPPEKGYSLHAEFERFLYLRNSTKKRNLNMRNFFTKGFNKDMEILMCDTKNFSIKALYLKKYSLLFDEDFYRGSDTDFGKQIIQKNGLILYCPDIKIYHWERSTLKEFLKQRWYIGRTTAKIGDKWKIPSFKANLPRPKTFATLLLFCNFLKQWRNLPILTTLLFLDRFYRINGWFYKNKYNRYDR